MIQSGTVSHLKMFVGACDPVPSSSDIAQYIPPAIAAMHGPYGVFDIGHCTVVHCDAGSVAG